MQDLEKKVKELEEQLLKLKAPLNSLNIKLEPKNLIDRLEKMLIIYAELQFPFEKRLLPAQRKILLYYLHKGLNDETLSTVCEDNPSYDKNYLHGINKKLRDKGYLIKDKNNYQKFHLNSDLEAIRKKVMIDDCKLMIITCV